jgi:CHAT domain-containing protein
MAVVELLGRASILHFAGHAVFNPDEPERSFLALTGAADDDGRLAAREIGALRLSKTYVVVLSACSTMNPRPTRAGPMAGLAHSFLSAGVPVTISTLWDVSDRATTELLVEVHRGLATGGDATAVLRRAQLRALHSSDPTLSVASTWAAFTSTGS